MFRTRSYDLGQSENCGSWVPREKYNLLPNSLVCKLVDA